MKKILTSRSIPIITLVAVLSCPAGFCQSPSASPSPSPSASADGGGPRCTLNSSIVEVYSFYGSKKTVTEKVVNLPVNLSERRVYLQITQSGRTDSAKTDVKLFEQQKDGSFTVTEWTKTKAPGLFDEIDDAIIKNKGKNCVGEAIKAVLARKLGPGKTAAPLAAPGSPKDAFAPSVQDASGDFIKSVIIFGC